MIAVGQVSLPTHIPMPLTMLPLASLKVTCPALAILKPPALYSQAQWRNSLGSSACQAEGTRVRHFGRCRCDATFGGILHHNASYVCKIAQKAKMVKRNMESILSLPQ